MDKANRSGWIDVALLAPVIIWGANYSVVKATLAQMRPLAFDALRMTLGSLVALGLTWLVERDVSLPRGDWNQVMALGLVGNFFYQLLFIQGIARTTATNSSLLLAYVPIWVAVGGTLTRSEKLHGWNWAGVLLSFAGIVLLIAGGGHAVTVNSTTLLGDVLVGLGALCWATYTLYSLSLLQRCSPLKATTWIMLSSTPLLILAGVPDLRAQNWQAITPQGWLGLLYSSVFAIGLSYVIWSMGIQRVGSARTSLYAFLQPLVSVTVAWLFLGEHMQPRQMIGAVGILMGVALGRYRPKTQ
jgi:drug/metabolite transporter (DMT)-like permease